MKFEEKVNIKRLTSVIKKNIIEIIIIVFLVTLCGCFYSYNMVTPKYKSTSTILLANNNINETQTSVTQTEVNLNKSLISTYGNILKSNKVLGQVINNLGLDITEEELYKNIQIDELENTQIIQISTINENPIEAQKITEELNNVFIKEINEIYKMDNVTIIDGASFEEEPYNVNHIKDILTFFVIGIILASCVIGVIFVFDTTIKVEQDIEEYVGLKVVGSIPNHKEKKELVVQNNAKSLISESLRTIRTNLSYLGTGHKSKSILVTSCNPGEGKSWVASNMAVTYAQADKNVIIVDADMRKGRQDKIFDVRNNNGLSLALREIKNNQDFETLGKHIKDTMVPKVHIMTVGILPPNPSELLLSNQMKDLVYMLKCMYDVVIIDGTPCNLVSDSIPISRIVDTTILIAESRKTKIEDLKNVVKQIKSVDGKEIRAVLNKKEIKKKEYGKGYYGQSGDSTKFNLRTYTVNELIASRKSSLEDEKIFIQEPQKENAGLEKLTEKIEDLENKLSKIPEMNLESYTKIADEIRKTYENELDKNKLAEEIKEHILNNELIKRLDENSNDLKSILNINNNELKDILSFNNEDLKSSIGINSEELKNILDNNSSEFKNILDNNSSEFKNILDNNSSDLKNILDNNSSEFKNILDNNSSEFKSILDNNSSDLKNILDNNSSEFKNILSTKNDEIKNALNSNNEEIIETLNESANEMTNLLIEEIEQVKIGNDISSITEGIKELEEQQTVEMEKSNKQQLEEIQRLDNSDILTNLITEIEKLNTKISEDIKNNETEENIYQMLKQIKQETEGKIYQALDGFKKETETKIAEIDNSKELKEIMQELKSINSKYDMLSEKIAEISKDKEEKVIEKEVISNKNKIVDLNKRFIKKPLVIEYGKEIEYESLLDYSIDVFEINPNESKVI